MSEPLRFPSRAEREALARERASSAGGVRGGGGGSSPSQRYEYADLATPGWYEVEVTWTEERTTSKGKPAWQLTLGALGTGRKRDWLCPLGWAERVEQLLAALLPELAEAGGAADAAALRRIKGRRCGARWDRQGGEGEYADRCGWQELCPTGELPRRRAAWGADQAAGAPASDWAARQVARGRAGPGPTQEQAPEEAADDLPF